jgi:endonuclease/exonuclease/phosphatase family metal-dependent hydrolase
LCLIFKEIFVKLTALILNFLCFGLLMSVNRCTPYSNLFLDEEAAEKFFAKKIKPAPAPVNGLKVMNWNLKFGAARADFFFDCWGTVERISKAQTRKNLEALAAKINELNPDVIFVQEIDIKSDRISGVDMLQYLLDHTQMNYAHYASGWQVGLLPKNKIHYINSGNAILSRWPLADGTRIALPERTDQPELERQYYLKRNMLRSLLAIPDYPEVYLVNVHTDAYGQDGTKLQHIDMFKAEMDRLKNEEKTLVIGSGDLNTLPPGTQHVKSFPDSNCKEEFIADDYTEEAEWLTPLYSEYDAETPLDVYHANESLYYSHTVKKDDFWNRKLDYIFTSGKFVLGSGKVHQQGTMPLSDHAPVTATLDWGL